MTKQIKDQFSDHVFTVEEVEPGLFQSVFPERIACESSLHATEDDAWEYINGVIARDVQDNSQFGVGGIAMSGPLEFNFEELAILNEGGVSAGLMNGTAEISYYPDGEFHVGKIYLDGYRKRADGGFDRVPVELEHDTYSRSLRTLHAQLYLAIWSELTDGSFKSHVEAAVSKALEDDGVPSRDMNAEHRLASQQMGAR